MTTNTVTLQTAHIVSLGDIEEAKASIKTIYSSNTTN